MSKLTYVVLFFILFGLLSITSPFFVRLKKSVEPNELSDGLDDDNKKLVSEEQDFQESIEEKLRDRLIDNFFDEFPDDEQNIEVVAGDSVDLLGVFPEADLENLEETAEDDGVWLDGELQEAVESLPPNYHNVSEFRTEIDGDKVDVKQTIDKATGKNGNSALITNIIHSLPKNDSETFACSLAEPCDDEQYCFETQFSSECLTCLVLASRCIDDAQCCAGDGDVAICVDGICAAGISPGSSGTICETSDDCQAGMCCASVKDFPRTLCKPLAKLNERCSRPSIVLADVMFLRDRNYYCPCEDKLSCEMRQVTLKNLFPFKYSEERFCKTTQDGNDSIILDIDKEGDSSTPFSGEDILKLLEIGEAESIQDQRFFIPPDSQPHKNTKKAMETDS